MFGFGKEDFGRSELENHLTEWGMKPELIRAFMDEFSSDACRCLKNLYRGYRSNFKNMRAHVIERDLIPMALTRSAFDAWDRKIRTGRIVNPDAELAVWAIMYNRSDLYSGDERLIANSAEKKYPEISKDAFLPKPGSAN